MKEIKGFILLSSLLLGVVLTGCRTPKTESSGHYETVSTDPSRDMAAAIRLTEEGQKHLQKQEWAKAQASFKAALERDVMHGPAHNNLGKAYYMQNNFYLAAWEFQYAAKLMPQSAQPINNLALVHEKVGKLSEAVQAYEQALTLSPNHPEIMGNLARACLKRGDKDDRIRQLLADLILYDTRPDWTDWAKTKLALLGGPPLLKQVP